MRRSARSWWRGLAALAVVGLALGFASAPARATDWSSFGVDGLRTRSSAERLGSRFAPSWRWDIAAGPGADAVYRSFLASPAVADGVVVVASYGNVVRALREADGAPLWETRLPDAVFASPVIAAGWVYVACLDRHLYAHRLSDGARLWDADLGGIVYSSPVYDRSAPDGRASLLVAAGAPQPRLLRVDAEKGTTIWTAGADWLQQSIDSSPAVAGGHVVVGETNGRFHAFALSDGRHEWLVEREGTVGFTSPIVLGSRAYLSVAGPTASLVAVDLATGGAVAGGDVDLTGPVGGPAGTDAIVARRIVLSSPGTADGLIVVGARTDDSIDTDGNGLADRWRLRERVLAFDPGAARVAWVVDSGGRDVTDPNQIPTHGLAPSPAIHSSLAGDSLVVATSTLSPRVSILDLRDGSARATIPLPSATRASPASANGRLVVATDTGAVVALGSLENCPPSSVMRLWPSGGMESDAAGTVVRWQGAADIDGDGLTYELRWDTDGEVLHDALGTEVTPPGITTWRLPPLPPGYTVTYAVRTRDSRGAWSSWSAAETFVTTAAPPVSIGTQPVAGLSAAVRMAHPGDVVRLGLGRYLLAETLRIPDGVSVQGAAPHLTVLDGRGLATAVTLSASSPSRPATLRDVTVRGAATGVATEPGAVANLHNVVISDNGAFGIDVGASGTATVMGATLYRNDVAARSFGRLDIRNSIVASNRRGLVALPAEAISTRYNDLFGNQVSYENVAAGAGDLAVEVAFRAAESGDLRVMDGAATTDKGDPGDDFAREPLPNGGRINMGAFAGTESAEVTPVLGQAVGGPGTPPVPVAPAAKEPETPAASAGGCTLAPASRGSGPERLRDVAGVAVLVLLGWMAGRRRRR